MLKLFATTLIGLALLVGPAESRGRGATRVLPAQSCPPGATVIASGGSISAGYTATATGGILCIGPGSYTMGSQLTVAKAITIIGVGQPTITQTFTGLQFSVSSANVRIQNIKIIGNSRGVIHTCSGGSSGFYVSGNIFKLYDSWIDSFACALDIDGVDGFEINRNRWTNHKYYAMAIYGAQNGLVDSNRITDLNADGVEGNNTYGVTMGSDAISSNITVSNNYVRNSTWECYDAHWGHFLSFTNNTCIDVAVVGINASTGDGNDLSNIIIEGNTIDAGSIFTNQENSIVLTQCAGTCSLMNNTIIGFGGCAIFNPTPAPTTGTTCN